MRAMLLKTIAENVTLKLTKVSNRKRLLPVVKVDPAPEELDNHGMEVSTGDAPEFVGAINQPRLEDQVALEMENDVLLSSIKAELVRLEFFTRYMGLSIVDKFKRSSRPMRLFVFIVKTAVFLQFYFMVVRTLVSLCLPNLSDIDRIAYLGDFAALLGGTNKMYLTMVLLSWFLNAGITLGIYLTHDPFIPKFEKTWFTAIKIARELPLQKMDTYAARFRSFRNKLYVCNTLMCVVLGGAIFTAAIEPAVRFLFKVNIVAYVFWMFHFLLAGIMSFIISFTSMGQFVFICKLIQLGFRGINANLEYLSNEMTAESPEGSAGPKEKDKLVQVMRQINVCHFNLIETLSVGNVFWKKYLFGFYLTLVPVVCFIIYQYWTSSVGLLVKGAFFVCLLVFAYQIIFVSMAAALVSHEAHAAYDTLYGLTLKESCPDFRSEACLLLERLNGPTIGFYFWDFFPITKNILTTVFSAIVTYFLLINDVTPSS